MTQINQTPAWFHYPKYEWKNKHAVVIGAGIAGCQAAWHLVQQGWQVSLIEREPKVAQQASGNPAGIISPKMTAQASLGESFYADCFDYAIKQLKQLKQKHSQLDWHDCGLLQLAHNQREQQRWQALNSRNFNRGFLQLLKRDQSSEIAGILLDYKASYFPQAGWINPLSFCESLIADCKDNCNVVLETEVIDLEYHHDKWRLLNQQQQVLSEAEVIIIASGKDLHQFSYTKRLPSMPVAGQTTFASSNAFAKQLKTTIGHQGYLTPVSDTTTQLTFGASFERNNDKAELNIETDKTNLRQLSKYLPQLADSFKEVKSAHAAIRMTTPDRFPYLGGIADNSFFTESYSDLHQGKQYKKYPNAQYVDGLFVLAGLGSRGLTSSGLCAKILSSIINNDSPNENLSIQQHCHPARFIIKDLKRGKGITKEH